tara:strand:+ start:2468 stop:3583 length:1116 start_codon:yes stop_codon:yes gene_type:complete
MKESIKNFEDSVDKQVNIISYTTFMIDTFGNVSPDNNDLHNLFLTFLKAGKTEYSQFIYNGIIVSLYGSFERLIEDIVESYLTSIICHSDTFEKLPSAIKKNHTELSLALALKVGKDRNREIEEKSKLQSVIISNLNTCMINKDGYKLNVSAFSSHTANFRLDIVRETFSNIGLSSIIDDLANNIELIDFVRAEKGYGEDENVTNNEVASTIRFKLDDLANRRNEIAHGTKPQNYLDYNLLLSFCEFMKIIGKAIYTSCSTSNNRVRLKNIDLSHYDTVYMNNPKVFIKPGVIGFKIEDVTGLSGFNLKIGTKIFITNNNDEIQSEATLVSLIVNKSDANEYLISEAFEFGIKLDIPLENSFSRRKFFFYN